MMRLKDHSVVPSGLHPRLVEALFIADDLHRLATGKELVITSLRDGKHKTGSKHYSGEAADLRIHYLPRPDIWSNELAAKVGPDFDVLLEGDHIHVEYDPD